MPPVPAASTAESIGGAPPVSLSLSLPVAGVVVLSLGCVDVWSVEGELAVGAVALLPVGAELLVVVSVGGVGVPVLVAEEVVVADEVDCVPVGMPVSSGLASSGLVSFLPHALNSKVASSATNLVFGHRTD